MACLLFVADAVEYIKEGRRSYSSFWSLTKQWAVPKLLIPLGLDSEGRPTSCTCWGKAVPVENLYDDEFVKTWDLAFMYKVRRAVQVLHAVGSLARVESPLTADIFGASEVGQALTFGGGARL
eukprot:SAG31_NODE_99_length_25388_cov_12.710507_7_plen_123_part_00